MRIRRSRAGRMALVLATLLAGLPFLQGCNVMQQTPEHMRPPPGHGPFTGTVADWPLWFGWHQFGVHCYDVQECSVLYGGMQQRIEEPRPSLESLGRPLDEILHAGRGPVQNFPAPAEVKWVAKDGTPLEARVDMGEIFADRLVRHTVPREDIMEDANIPYPGIILMVDDRTISVYMSTWIPLNQSRVEGNPGRRFHTGVVLVHSTKY